ncbi:phosphoenolpyruvate--protein phosphotransferase [Acidocella sp.]|uniref:phosphoenolpyruvate--protein phosphotransferase n=1 Tax=Acidocella sp. TaxID=50710 RepID=UPI0026399F75|nr:phosphoenolpyruvate--protein phosphotransferase [Acidocella sp.]
MKRTEAKAPAQERRLTGHPVSPGIAIGPLHEAAETALTIPERRLEPDGIAAELARLEEAVARSRHQLQKLKGRLSAMPEGSQAELAPLLDMYLHMLGSSRLLRLVKARIEQDRQCAEAAVQAVAEAQAEAILAQAGPDRAGRQRRADEVREVARRLLRNLTRQPFRSFEVLPQGSILAARDLRPAEAALINPARFAGIVTAEGGLDGHTAVMLRALGLPAVLGAARLFDKAEPGCTVIVDGESGEIILNPAKASLEAARRKLAAQTRARRALARLQHLPAQTRCGVQVDLLANLELPFELPMIAESGARGIGLLRSEFMFMNREDVPDEDTQARSYQDIVEAMDGETVTIRLLDWGSDKDVESLSAYLPEHAEPNPALGLRGIRLLLHHPKLLETQLAAILRAAAAGPVRILVPMVSVAAEITATRAALRRVWRRLQRRRNLDLPEKPPPLGIMVETPAAALAAPRLAREADFFALGTNDLTMYTLAADRSLPGEVRLYDPLEPAVLRLIHLTCSFAAGAGVPVCLCGELAGRPEAAALLLGLGVRQLSMHGPAVPRVKRAIRASTLVFCEELAGEALAAPDAAAVRALLAQAAF